MFEYFYNEILRRTIIAFGTLFNNISITHTDSSDNTVSVTKVPLAYGPTQKFLARLTQSPDLNKSTAITLPRMSFEFTGMTYDPSRKVSTTQQFVVQDPNTTTPSEKIAYMPVPYNMQFELAIMTKLNDDALQIVEQILPYFQPSYNVTVELVSTIKEKRDIPIVLENITMQDDYEGDFTSRRVLYYTLRFTAKTYLFGPISSASTDIIRKSNIRYLSGDSKSTTRDVTYSSEPRAVQSYTTDIITQLSEDLITEDGKPVPTVFTVDDASGIIVSGVNNVYIDVDGEEMRVKSKSGNKVTVERGQDGTKIINHLRGAPIKAIGSVDNSFVLSGDDFGFSGTMLPGGPT